MRITMFLAIVLALGVGACDDKKDEPPATSATTQPPKTATPPPAASASPPTVASSAPPSKPTAEFKLATVGNTMLYDVTTFTVSAGQPVHLILHNNSTMKLLPHNWALVKAGTEAAVAAAGLKKGEQAGYLDTESSDVLAYSPTAAMGATVEVTFTAPAQPGSYPYICTVPGHYLKMKGTLIVTP